MKQSEIELLLNQVAEEGVAYLHGLGYAFFKGQFLKALNEAENYEIEKELISECWYIAGDIYDFNDSPITAIKAYQKSATFDPEFADAYKEMAHMQEKIGAYALAMESLKKAIELDGNDTEAKDDLLAIEESIKFGDEPLFKSTNAVWFLNELLSNDDFEKVLEQTKGAVQVNELKRRACALGAQGEIAQYLEIWMDIEKANDDVEIEYMDWFFMPDEVYNGKEIWELFKKMNMRIISEAFIQSESLQEQYPKLKDEEARELICDYHILKNTANEAGLMQLAKKFPKWEEVQFVNN